VLEEIFNKVENLDPDCMEDIMAMLPTE